MKKKRIELTVEEVRSICDKHDMCRDCPLWIICGMCLQSDSLTSCDICLAAIQLEGWLNEEVEVEE